MALSEAKVKTYIRRLLLSRMRLLSTNGFYGLLLMHMGFALDEHCETAATDGRKIVFDPKFMDEISDRELDFIMMHEILHVVLMHCLRTGERDEDLFNIACDVVVNSNILKSYDMDTDRITVQGMESMHRTLDEEEGYLYTAEEVYEQLCMAAGKSGSGKSKHGKGKGADGGTQAGDKLRDENGDGQFHDDHSRWGDGELKQEDIDLWVKRIREAAAAMEVRDPSNRQGLLPACVQRLLKELRNPQTDWRTILNDFVQQEITDYSFTPPDRRFADSDFFLPDFNDKEDIVEDILFMVDTSGSMSDEMIAAAYSEVKGAIDQFDGKLKGWLGFFDTAVTEPQAFSEVGDIRTLRPVGGGGTNFRVIFQYVKEYMQERRPACIIILTDGYADIPDERSALGIPVLWLLNNEEVTPKWGRIARITLPQRPW